ncbi:hypothetical protein BOX15_Mlig029102g2 [Macrostomum lignano]|uniref:Uncharacterized protein n=1 Tax=Macrostomum lignano TaxID=282301 RepID=A0A267GFL0_9PLAT|nr:hypothetical protein BOX15_Mlig029102g2 [Macrostomum lignano]
MAQQQQLDDGKQVIFGLISLDRGELLFVLVHSLSIVCAAGFYVAKNHQLLSTDALHRIAAVLGILFLSVIFGSNVLYIILQVGLAWLILSTVRDSRSAAILILIDSMAILCYLQVKRIMQKDLGTVDFTAPVMISTQKLTALAFSLHDYSRKDRDRLPEENQRLMVEKKPTLLQLASFVFFFHGVVVGPISFYSEYIHFMEEQPLNFKARGRKRALVRHMLLTLVLVSLMLVLAPRWQPDTLLDYAQQRPFLVRVFLTYLVMMVARLKYYFAWNLGSCIQLAAGYGYDRQKEDWTGIKNVSIMGLEAATSMRSYIDAWNTSTNAWLRLLAYSRLPPKFKMIGTFVLSAMWHGFYPGYYFTFLFAVPTTVAARRIRRIFRPRFLAANQLLLYHVITWFCTQLILAYIVVPFTLLHLNLVLSYYHGTMMWTGHIVVFVALAATFVLPAPPRSKVDSQTGAKASTTVGSALAASEDKKTE